MLGYKRTDRVGDQIRLEVADILTRRMKDPRVGFVTITSVDLSADLRQAWIYVTVLQEGEQGNEAIATLARATGFIRGELGRRLKLRYVPELTFLRDRSVDQVRHVMSLLDSLPELGEKESVPADSRAGGCNGAKESVLADEQTPSNAVEVNEDRTPDDASGAGTCNHEGTLPKGQRQ